MHWVAQSGNSYQHPLPKWTTGPWILGLEAVTTIQLLWKWFVWVMIHFCSYSILSVLDVDVCVGWGVCLKYVQTSALLPLVHFPNDQQQGRGCLNTQSPGAKSTLHHKIRCNAPGSGETRLLVPHTKRDPVIYNPPQIKNSAFQDRSFPKTGG